MVSSVNQISCFDFTAKQLLKEESFISSGCSVIDKLLRGGFSKQGITQIYGQAGTGKSQIALQLCLSVQQIVDQNKTLYGAAYICTEAAFPVKRLQQMLQNSQICKQNTISTDMIFVEHINSVDDLETYLNLKLPILLNTRKIGVLIIDSIAAPFAVEYENEQLKNRAMSLRKIGYQLHHISRSYDMSIICINQVRADLNNAESEVPALGITWEHAITHSIYLYKINKKRFARIISSPYLPQKIIEFEVYDSGVRGIKEL